jgi:hypothetical protein
VIQSMLLKLKAEGIKAVALFPVIDEKLKSKAK